MSEERLGIADYPIAEKWGDQVRGQRGKTLTEVTIDSLVSGVVEMEDLRISAAALNQQAEIARASGREALARNFERGAEMTVLPQAEIMEIYELLRPGRAREKSVLLVAAERLRRLYSAQAVADLVEEAAEVYERRGLFNFRY